MPAEAAARPADSTSTDSPATQGTIEFRALGSHCRIDVWCPPGGPAPETLAGSAVELIADLETRWTRFHPGSELSRLNRHAGIAVPVSPCTVELVAMAAAAWDRTDGAFDPTVGAALITAGYDRTFEEMATARSSVSPGTSSLPDHPNRQPVPGCSDILVDHASGTVTLPVGTMLDLGGIGKGRAADLTAAHLMGLGALGTCVDLGGDLRVAGQAPAGGRWVIEIDDPDAPGVALASLAIADTGGAGGAVATSSTTRRQWEVASGRAHHLIDPATGRPSTSGVVAATVIAADATWAEVLAKAAVIAGPDRGSELITDAGLAGLLVVRSPDGRDLRHVGDLASYLVAPAVPPDTRTHAHLEAARC